MVRASLMSRRRCSCPTGVPTTSAASDVGCTSCGWRKTPFSWTSMRRRRNGRKMRPRMSAALCRLRRHCSSHPTATTTRPRRPRPREGKVEYGRLPLLGSTSCWASYPAVSLLGAQDRSVSLLPDMGKTCRGKRGLQWPVVTYTRLEWSSTL